MSREHQNTVYQLNSSGEGSGWPPASYYESAGIDPNGSDLEIASSYVRKEYALARISRGEEISGTFGESLRQEGVAILKDLEQEAADYHETLKGLLEQLSEQDKASAEAVQHWTLAELERRIEERGYDYPATDERTYTETLGVLTKLIDELEDDEESAGLINLAEAWRDEVRAELVFEQARSVRHEFELAA